MRIFDEALGAALKVGDLVAIGEPAGGLNQIPARIRWVEPIMAVTATQVTVGQQRWNRRTGRRVGEKPLKWVSSPSVQIVGIMTQAEADAWRERSELKKAETKERAELLNLFEEIFYQRQKSPVWSWPMEKVRHLKNELR